MGLDNERRLLRRLYLPEIPFTNKADITEINDNFEICDQWLQRGSRLDELQVYLREELWTETVDNENQKIWKYVLDLQDLNVYFTDEWGVDIIIEIPGQWSRDVLKQYRGSELTEEILLNWAENKEEEYPRIKNELMTFGRIFEARSEDGKLSLYSYQKPDTQILICLTGVLKANEIELEKDPFEFYNDSDTYYRLRLPFYTVTDADNAPIIAWSHDRISWNTINTGDRNAYEALYAAEKADTTYHDFLLIPPHGSLYIKNLRDKWNTDDYYLSLNKLDIINTSETRAGRNKFTVQNTASSDIILKGNLKALLNDKNFYSSCFQRMFLECMFLKAIDFTLPKDIATNCYTSMFEQLQNDLQVNNNLFINLQDIDISSNAFYRMFFEIPKINIQFINAEQLFNLEFNSLSVSSCERMFRGSPIFLNNKELQIKIKNNINNRSCCSMFSYSNIDSKITFDFPSGDIKEQGCMLMFESCIIQKELVIKHPIQNVENQGLYGFLTNATIVSNDFYIDIINAKTNSCHKLFYGGTFVNPIHISILNKEANAFTQEVKNDQYDHSWIGNLKNVYNHTQIIMGALASVPMNFCPTIYLDLFLTASSSSHLLERFSGLKYSFFKFSTTTPDYTIWFKVPDVDNPPNVPRTAAFIPSSHNLEFYGGKI